MSRHLLPLLAAVLAGCAGNGLRFARLPTGAGRMGAVESFSLNKTEVTVGEYAKCVSAGACAAAPLSRDEQKDRCNGKHDRRHHPMNCVTWAEAEAFCEWVGGRLPTAAEWDYAATSGVPDRRYPWGDTLVDGRKANYCDVNCPRALGTDGKNLDKWEAKGWIDHGHDDGFAGTAPVGRYKAGATPWGLLDMAGNVWEWTSSVYGDSGQREVRGGSWDNAPPSLATTRRLAWPVDAADAGMGFRCARDARTSRVNASRAPSSRTRSHPLAVPHPPRPLG